MGLLFRGNDCAARYARKIISEVHVARPVGNAHAIMSRTSLIFSGRPTSKPLCNLQTPSARGAVDKNMKQTPRYWRRMLRAAQPPQKAHLYHRACACVQCGATSIDATNSAATACARRHSWPALRHNELQARSSDCTARRDAAAHWPSGYESTSSRRLIPEIHFFVAVLPEPGGYSLVSVSTRRDLSWKTAS